MTRKQREMVKSLQTIAEETARVCTDLKSRIANMPESRWSGDTAYVLATALTCMREADYQCEKAKELIDTLQS